MRHLIISLSLILSVTIGSAQSDSTISVIATQSAMPETSFTTQEDYNYDITSPQGRVMYEESSQYILDALPYQVTTVGPVQNIGQVTYSDKQGLDLEMNLEYKIKFDYSQVQSKQKMKTRIVGTRIDQYFKGDIVITSTIALQVREPKSQELIKVIPLDLPSHTIYIENETGLNHGSLYGILLGQEEVPGITDEYKKGLSLVEQDLRLALRELLTFELLTELTSISHTIQSNH